MATISAQLWDAAGTSKLFPRLAQSWVYVNGSTLTSKLNSLKNSVASAMHPVGSIFMAQYGVISDSFDPSSLVSGSTWKLLGTDTYYPGGRIIVGAGDTYTAGQDINPLEATHVLTVNEIPSHSHQLGSRSHSSGSAGADNTSVAGTGGRWLENWGGSVGHNNIMPFITVKMWERIS